MQVSKLFRMTSLTLKRLLLVNLYKEYSKLRKKKPCPAPQSAPEPEPEREPGPNIQRMPSPPTFFMEQLVSPDRSLPVNRDVISVQNPPTTPHRETVTTPKRTPKRASLVHDDTSPSLKLCSVRTMSGRDSGASEQSHKIEYIQSPVKQLRTPRRAREETFLTPSKRQRSGSIVSPCSGPRDTPKMHSPGKRVSEEMVGPSPFRLGKTLFEHMAVAGTIVSPAKDKSTTRASRSSADSGIGGLRLFNPGTKATLDMPGDVDTTPTKSRVSKMRPCDLDDTFSASLNKSPLRGKRQPQRPAGRLDFFQEEVCTGQNTATLVHRIDQPAGGRQLHGAGHRSQPLIKKSPLLEEKTKRLGFKLASPKRFEKLLRYVGVDDCNSVSVLLTNLQTETENTAKSTGTAKGSAGGRRRKR